MHADITYLCIRDYYNTEDGKNEGVVIYDEGSIDSEYEEEDDQVVVLDKYLFSKLNHGLFNMINH